MFWPNFPSIHINPLKAMLLVNLYLSSRAVGSRGSFQSNKHCFSFLNGFSTARYHGTKSCRCLNEMGLISVMALAVVEEYMGIWNQDRKIKFPLTSSAQFSVIDTEESCHNHNETRDYETKKNFRVKMSALRVNKAFSFLIGLSKVPR